MKILIVLLLFTSSLVFAETKVNAEAKVDSKAKAKVSAKAKVDSKAKVSAKAKAKVDSKAKAKVSAKAKADSKAKAKVSAKAKSPANTDNNNIEYSKVVTVHGMVCAFCSNSLEKKFKKEEAIDQVKVDLTSKKVSVLFKKGQSIENKKLKEIITSAGFKVVAIESAPNKG